MQQPINIIHYAIPFFVLFLLLEVALNVYERKDWYIAKDTFSSLAMGIGNQLVGLGIKGIVFASFFWFYEHRFFTLDMSQWWMWTFLFLGDDFTYYWFHRLSHSVRFFWASHVVHHSSQKYNLGTALRQTWTGDLTGTFFFWLWMPLVGFHPLMIFLMKSVSLIYQFWIHTEAIYKFPKWIEYIWNTPSHHRVHHASDVEYLDKNHAGILIIWDRIFGTFIEEQKRPTYGLVSNLDTHNPIQIAFHEWKAIIKNVRQSPRYAWKYIFGAPGWSHDGTTKTTKELQK
jgi:sterol desaturase/sphingolipid hydroxylase (fatty acid hydroxylase superfamily)